jgi:hypothetical protein
MYYQQTNVSKPTAHITKKKSRLKVYNGHNVFLNDKDNFEFEIHNPTQKSILCKIKLNGEYISSTGIIVRPGQRVFLERFLDSNNKFEFSTYEVKDTTENRSAIDLNGDVRIEFYDEQMIVNYPHLSGGDWSNGWTTINTGSHYYGNMTFTTANSSTGYYSSSVVGATTPQGPNIKQLSTKKSFETGRVEKGEKSNQKFTTSYENFNYFTSHEISFKLLPFNNKHKTVNEIKHYCTECGTKTKSKYKFCPSCGNDLLKPKETKISYTDDTKISVGGTHYLMSTYNITLDKLIELNIGKTIVIHKPSLSETQLRAIIY